MALKQRRFSFFIALRYLFSRKKVGAINIISGISIAAIAFSTAALLCTIAVFNGFYDLIDGLFTTFDPQIEVVPAKGKFIESTDARLRLVSELPDVEAASQCLEDNALILFYGRPTVIMLKGVDDQFDRVTGIRSILYGEGTYKLHQANLDFGIPGIGLASLFGRIDYGTMQICAPRKGERINLANPSESINSGEVCSPGVCFDVNQSRYDANYLIVPLRFAQNLFEQPGQITGVEFKLKPGADLQQVKAQMQAQLGAEFKVLDRYEQQPDVFSMMKIEKLAAYLFLTFILIIACFNVIGCISMLIINKRTDALTLYQIGAPHALLFRIFLYVSRLITVIGAVIGIALGAFLCWLQQTFGLIKLGSSGNFIIDAYPVSLYWTDVLVIFLTVIVVGFVSVWYPVKYLCRRLL